MLLQFTKPLKFTQLARLSIRLLITWLILSVIGLVIASRMVDALIPFFSDILDSMSTDYTKSLRVSDNSGDLMLEITAVVQRPIKVSPTLAIPAGKTYTASIHVLHVMVPLIILYSLLLTWPVATRQDRFQLLLFGIPVTFIILGFTIPALLEGHIEMQLLSMIHNAGGTRDNQFLLGWVVFIEMGGLWLLPVIGAIVCSITLKEIHYLNQCFNGSRKGTNKSNMEISNYSDV